MLRVLSTVELKAEATTTAAAAAAEVENDYSFQTISKPTVYVCSWRPTPTPASPLLCQYIQLNYYPILIYQLQPNKHISIFVVSCIA